MPVLAAHMDVNALDLWGIPPDMRTAAEESAMENIKRVARPPRDGDERFDWLDDGRAQRPEWIARVPRDEDGLAPDRDLRAVRQTT